MLSSRIFKSKNFFKEGQLKMILNKNHAVISAKTGNTKEDRQM